MGGVSRVVCVEKGRIAWRNGVELDRNKVKLEGVKWS